MVNSTLHMEFLGNLISYPSVSRPLETEVLYFPGRGTIESLVGDVHHGVYNAKKLEAFNAPNLAGALLYRMNHRFSP